MSKYLSEKLDLRQHFVIAERTEAIGLQRIGALTTVSGTIRLHTMQSSTRELQLA